MLEQHIVASLARSRSLAMGDNSVLNDKRKKKTREEKKHEDEMLKQMKRINALNLQPSVSRLKNTRIYEEDLRTRAAATITALHQARKAKAEKEDRDDNEEKEEKEAKAENDAKEKEEIEETGENEEMPFEVGREIFVCVQRPRM